MQETKDFNIPGLQFMVRDIIIVIIFQLYKKITDEKYPLMPQIFIFFFIVSKLPQKWDII